MTLKQQRLLFVCGGLAFMAIAAMITLTAFRDTMVFFFSPTELQSKAPSEQSMRIGGLVKAGSLAHDNEQVRFVLTDGAQEVTVQYQGILPDLFREGQGVVAEGKLSAERHFIANRIFAKHDENYMPPEVADALKQSGHWKDDYGRKP